VAGVVFTNLIGKENSMTTITTFIKRRPVLTYYVLTFAISWSGVLLVIGGPSALPSPSEQAMSLLPVAILVMLVGPSVAGLLMTGLVHGRAGLREFGSRLLKWRVSARWYAVALLATPLLITATLFALSLLSPEYLPGIFTTDDKAALLLMGLAVGLGAGIFEELGWTGFAIPALRRRYGVLATGLIVGVLWAVWHFLVYFWGSGDAAGAFSLALFLPEFVFLVAVAPVYRVLMVWVYDRTESLLVAMLMHAGLTASTTFILVPLATGMARVTYYLGLGAVLWVVVAAVVVANRGQLSRQGKPPASLGAPQLTPR
jgi:membrane protease YdiL (CAAX protease family)